MKKKVSELNKAQNRHTGNYDLSKICMKIVKTTARNTRLKRLRTEFSKLEIDFSFLVDLEISRPDIDLQGLNIELPEISIDFPVVELPNMNIDLVDSLEVLHFDLKVNY